MPGKKNKEIRDEEENQRHTDEHRRLGCLLGASEVDHRFENRHVHPEFNAYALQQLLENADALACVPSRAIAPLKKHVLVVSVVKRSV